MQSWVAAKFLAVPQAAAQAAYLLPAPLKPDSIGQTPMRNSIDGHPLLIGGRTFDHGLAMRTDWYLTNVAYGPVVPTPVSRNGVIRVIPPGAARSFAAIVGVDSNGVTDYSGGLNVNVVASVTAEGNELFRSPVLHEGRAGIEVKVELHGAHEFSLHLAANGERPTRW